VSKIIDEMSKYLSLILDAYNNKKILDSTIKVIKITATISKVITTIGGIGKRGNGRSIMFLINIITE